MNENDWDAVAARFEEEIFNVPANDRKGLIKAAVAKHADPRGIAADVGCGTGRTVALLVRHFGRVHAMDISRECLQIAAEHNRRTRNVTYAHADLVARPLPCPPADLALCINTLLLASRPARKRMLKHLCAVLKPGGHLVLVVPSMESVLLTHHMHRRWRDRSPHLRVRPETTVEGMEALEGIVRIDGVPTKHYLREEIEELLAHEGLKALGARKIEYAWTTEFERPPQWMKAPGPWDWLVEARKVR